MVDLPSFEYLSIIIQLAQTRMKPIISSCSEKGNLGGYDVRRSGDSNNPIIKRARLGQNSKKKT